MAGDTLASNFVSGFKEGVGFAYHKYHECLATDDHIQKYFRADQFIIRDENLHAEAVRGLQCGSTVSAHISVICLWD